MGGNPLTSTDPYGLAGTFSIIELLTHSSPVGESSDVTPLNCPDAFSSPDKHVADLANKIEDIYPGHVVGVNVSIRDENGNLVTDADILLKNAVIQVKSGGGKGMTSQLPEDREGNRITSYRVWSKLKGINFKRKHIDE